MKNILKYGFMLSLLAGAGCSEKDISLYEDSPAIYVEMLGVDGKSLRDSLVFSFPITTAETYRAEVRVRIVGFVADRDRTIDLGADAAKSTAVSGSHYEMPTTVTIPAGAYETMIPVTLKRSGLLGKEVRLVVALRANAEFELGFNRGYEAILRWGDKYIKPDNWDTSYYKDFFGTFTENKYAAVLEALEMKELPLPLKESYSVFGYYNRKVRDFLRDNPRYEPDGTPIEIPINNGGQGGQG